MIILNDFLQIAIGTWFFVKALDELYRIWLDFVIQKRYKYFNKDDDDDEDDKPFFKRF